jgi:hypothetical protein
MSQIIIIHLVGTFIPCFLGGALFVKLWERLVDNSRRGTNGIQVASSVVASFWIFLLTGVRIGFAFSDYFVDTLKGIIQSK